MKTLIRFSLVMTLLVLTLWGQTVYGDINKVYFDVYTQRDVSSGTPLTLRIGIELADTTGLRPPDAIDWSKPFTVTIPTSPTRTVYKVKILDWEEWSNGFYPIINPTAIGGTIPTGTYKLTLTDLSGHTFTSTKVLSSNTYLPAATITQLPVGTPPILKWTAVGGAKYYNIRLKDMDWGEPVYWYPNNKTRAVYVPMGELPSYTFPVGVIRTGHHYKIQVEARDNDQGLSKRSRSLWYDFVGP